MAAFVRFSSRALPTPRPRQAASTAMRPIWPSGVSRPVPMATAFTVASMCTQRSSSPSHSSSGGTFCSSTNTRVRISRNVSRSRFQSARRTLNSVIALPASARESRGNPGVRGGGERLQLPASVLGERQFRDDCLPGHLIERLAARGGLECFVGLVHAVLAHQGLGGLAEHFPMLFQLSGEASVCHLKLVEPPGEGGECH